MCTVSIVPRDDGFRLLCNRDERLSRPLALPPRWAPHGDVTAAYPIDPSKGGSWLAVNDRGLAIALLNRHPDRRVASASSRGRPLRSRGEIPLALIDAGTLDEIRRRVSTLDRAAYPAFLVVSVLFDRLLAVESDGSGLAIVDRRLTGPVAFTSSSLGDVAAQHARLPLFRALVRESRDPWLAQRAFHDHHWPAKPEMSVLMRRGDARTVSRTRVDVKGTRVVMDYEPLSALPAGLCGRN